MKLIIMFDWCIFRLYTCDYFTGADNIAAITSGVAIAGVLVIIVGIMIVVSIALYVTNKPENFLFGEGNLHFPQL